MTMDNERYMRRALVLARNGLGYASPNPMVGAVIAAPDGRVIGEGWHRLCGEAHAEVNAVASVKSGDEALLRESTMFVTLEPCSHYGKTPPCAEMIISRGIPRVVVGCVDPFAKVSGQGIAMLREAGVEVTVGVLENECRELNRRFFTAHTLRRPFITLKWARSADGFMDWRRDDAHPKPCRFSNALTTLSTMRLRSLHDAVLTTAATAIADGSRLTVRGWDGRVPLRVVVDRHGVLPHDAPILSAGSPSPLVFTGENEAEIGNVLKELYVSHGVTSVLLEAGACLLGTLLERGLWDVAREEVAPFSLGDRGAHPAPQLPSSLIAHRGEADGNDIVWYSNQPVAVR